MDDLKTPPMDDETTSIQPPKTTRNRSNSSGGGNRSRTKKTANADMDAGEVSQGFHGLFRLLSMLTRSEARFDPAEFKELGKSFHTLVNRFPALKFIFLILAPLAAISDFSEKLSVVFKHRKPREKKNKQTAQPPVVDADWTQVSQ